MSRSLDLLPNMPSSSYNRLNFGQTAIKKIPTQKMFPFLHLASVKDPHSFNADMDPDLPYNINADPDSMRI
jgi:hypothetical protein